MQDFWCKRGEDMNYDVLAERVSFFKEKKKGVNQMCEILDEVKEEEKNEGRLEGRKEGRKEGRLETLTELVGKGKISVSEAAQMANMSEEEFKKYL